MKQLQPNPEPPATVDPATMSSDILVVDDDQYQLYCLYALLRTGGYRVRTCDNAFQALAALRETPAEVIIADINMPEMNGLRLLERLRTFDQETPLIFITGNAELELAINAVRLQAFDFILKPFDPQQFLAVVAKAVAHRHQQLQPLQSQAALPGVASPTEDPC